MVCKGTHLVVFRIQKDEELRHTIYLFMPFESIPSIAHFNKLGDHMTFREIS